MPQRSVCISCPRSMVCRLLDHNDWRFFVVFGQLLSNGANEEWGRDLVWPLSTVFAVTNTSIIFCNIYGNNCTMGWFKMLYIVTFVGVFKFLIVLDDFSVFSYINFITCSMHQVATNIIRFVVAIYCCGWYIQGWRSIWIRRWPRTFYPNHERGQLINDYKNKNELKFKICNFEIQRWILWCHKI